MKKNFIINASKLSASVLFCAALVFAGCNKIENPKGGEVRFSITTEGSPITKTAYGEDGTGTGFQYINWINNDQIRIVSAQCTPTTSADYTVSRTGHQGNFDYGTVSSGSPLFWGEGTHTFYAVYPSPAVTGYCSISGSQITGSIPTTQGYADIVGTDAKVVSPDMKNQYMYAKATGSKANESVQLTFYPLSTALEFTIKNGFESTSSMQISSISLSSAAYALGGSFTANIDNTGVNSRCQCTTTSTDKTVTINFSTPVTVAYGKTLNFTFFLNPGNGGADGINDITFTISGTNLGTSTAFTRSAKLENRDSTPASAIAFPTHKKTRIKGLVIPEAVEWDIEGTIFVTPWANGESGNIALN